MISVLSKVNRYSVLVCALGLAACGEKSKNVNATGGTARGAKEIPDNTEDAKKPLDPADLVGKDAALIDATFNIDVTSLFGIGVCKGEVDFKFNAGISKEASAEMFEIPKGIVDCGLVGKINLAEVLGAFSKNPAQQVADPVVVKNNLINLKQIGAGMFSPPRPLMPNFIATKKDKLATINHTENVTVTSTTDGKTASGNVTVRTIGVDQSYKPVRMQRQFNKVLHFEVLNQGFSGADKFANLLFDRMEFKISLDPIAVLYIEFKGKVSDAMQAAKNSGAAGGGGAAGGLGGLADGPLIGALTKIIDVNIKMDLVKMKGVKDINSFAEEEGTDDLGEEIGGKKDEGEDEE